MIILKGRPFNRYIKLIEVAPISFSLKTIEEQNSIYSMFSQIFNACPTKIQFITLSLPSNLRKQLEILDMEIETEKNPQCKEVGKAYKEKLIRIFIAGLASTDIFNVPGPSPEVAER